MVKIKKPHLKGQYYRYRIRDPKKYEKFRWHDIGRPGFSARIAGYDADTGRWETQSIAIHKDDYKKGHRVKLKYGRPAIVKVSGYHANGKSRTRAYKRRKPRKRGE